MRPAVLWCLWLGIVPASVAQTCPSRRVWSNLSEEVFSTRAREVKALEQYAFSLTGPDEACQGLRTDGVVILRDGALLYEKYARGYDASKRHLTWSVSKSVLNALVGIAVKAGHLKTTDSICQHVPQRTQTLCGVTIEHLLSFTSGIAWQEVYENQSHQSSSVLAMLYGQGQSDMGAFVASHVLRHSPGTVFSYSSGDSALLSAVLRSAVSNAGGDDFPWTQLFEPLGMASAVWERDGRGLWVGSSYLYATARDLARFGQWLLDDGCHEGKSLLPEGWVKASTQMTVPSKNRATTQRQDGLQGWHFWLNHAVGGQRAWPSAPEDTFAAIGHWGQSVVVVPSMKLVIVRTGDDRDGSFRLNDFLAHALAVGKAP